MPDQQIPTAAALMTGVGRSAVAVVALRGPNAHQALSAFFHPANDVEFRAGQVRYGSWQSGDESESVIVTPIADNHFEIHCHGGSAATSRVLDQLASRGVAIVDGDVWQRLSGVPRLIAEAQFALSGCVTERTAGIAMGQVRGALQAWCVGGLETLSPETMALIRREAAAMQHHAAVTTRLDRAFRVVLVGAPNVGKSSLVNAIVGYDRSITMDLPGTTRDVLHADTVIDGLPVRVSDTAGMRDSDDAIEREGVSRARAAAEQADLIVHVHAIETGDGEDQISFSGSPVIQVRNKVDLSPRIRADADVIETVATTGQGVVGLIERIGKVLGARLPAADAPVPINDRQADGIAQVAAAETLDQIREALENLLG